MKTHYAGCDEANETTVYDYWDEKTLCGLVETESDLTNTSKNVTCKNCKKVIDSLQKKGIRVW